MYYAGGLQNKNAEWKTQNKIGWLQYKLTVCQVGASCKHLAYIVLFRTRQGQIRVSWYDPAPQKGKSLVVVEISHTPITSRCQGLLKQHCLTAI